MALTGWLESLGWRKRPTVRDVAQVRLEHITKSFGEGSAAIKAVDDVSLDVEDHDFMILLGPSGCGKSTLLRMIAGL